MMARVKKNLPAVGLAALLAATALTACSDSDCGGNSSALPFAGFYASGSNGTQTVSVSDMEVYGIGAPGDSILFDGKQTMSQLYIPFRLDSDTTTYVFHLLSDVASTALAYDTVRFIYERHVQFVSADCGVSYRFDIDTITSTGMFVDSVTCPKGYIDNANIENLKIWIYNPQGDTPLQLKGIGL